MKIGLNKFCYMRPPWCVTVDSSGAHAVCVCEIHQNLELLVGALPGSFDYEELFLNLVVLRILVNVCSIAPGIDTVQRISRRII